MSVARINELKCEVMHQRTLPVIRLLLLSSPERSEKCFDLFRFRHVELWHPKRSRSFGQVTCLWRAYAAQRFERIQQRVGAQADIRLHELAKEIGVIFELHQGIQAGTVRVGIAAVGPDLCTSIRQLRK